MSTPIQGNLIPLILWHRNLNLKLINKGKEPQDRYIVLWLLLNKN